MGSIDAGKHDSDQLDDSPSKHAISRNRDQIVQFEYTSIHGDDPDQALEHGHEWLGGAVDQFRDWMCRVGTHQLKQESREDQTIEQADAEKDQPRDSLQDFLIDVHRLYEPGLTGDRSDTFRIGYLTHLILLSSV